MRIALLGTFTPYRGGIAHYNHLLLQSLKQRHLVQAVNFRRQYPDLLFPGKTQLMVGSKHVSPGPLLLDSINPVTWIKTHQFIKRQGCKLLIFKYWMPFFALSLGTLAFLGRRSGSYRTLAIIDNLIPHERHPGDMLLTRFFVNQVDHFLVMSRSVQRDLLSIKPRAHFRLVPHPLYSNFGEPVPRCLARQKLGIKEKYVILYFGFIRSYKGVEYLIQALPQIHDKLDVRTIIAGEFYEDPGPYLKAIEQTGCSDKITLISDFIPDNQVRYYFSVADLVVLPYVSATQSGIVKIALYYEKPCLVTSVGGLPEIVHDGRTGLVVPPKDSEALAQKVIFFFQEADRHRFIREIQKEKTKYSWEALVRAIEDLTGN